MPAGSPRETPDPARTTADPGLDAAYLETLRDLASPLGDEVRRRLQGALLNLAVTRRALDEGQPQRARESLARAEAAASRLNGIVAGILGCLENSWRDGDLVRLLAAFHRLLEAVTPRPGPSLESHLPGAPLLFQAPSDTLRKALIVALARSLPPSSDRPVSLSLVFDGDEDHAELRLAGARPRGRRWRIARSRLEAVGLELVADPDDGCVFNIPRQLLATP
jgi:hypothetical protein